MPETEECSIRWKCICFEWNRDFESDNLIQGMCSFNGFYLISIIDMGATHSFISLDSVKKLNLKVSFMIGVMVIDTPN